MARSKRHYYDTSRYISLPLAVALATAGVLILLAVGYTYSALGSDWLGTKALAPSGGLKRCADEQTSCLKRKNKEYTTCTTTQQGIYKKCVKSINSKLSKKEKDAARLICELEFGRAVDACTVSACAPGVMQCLTAKECIQKIYDKKALPKPVPPKPVPPKKDVPAEPKPVPPKEPEGEAPAPTVPAPSDTPAATPEPTATDTTPAPLPTPR